MNIKSEYEYAMPAIINFDDFQLLPSIYLCEIKNRHVGRQFK